MTNEKKLREVINDSGYKICFIAKQVGISYQGLLNKITNKTEFTASEMQKLCDLLKISSADRDAIFFGQEGDETSPEVENAESTN